MHLCAVLRLLEGAACMDLRLASATWRLDLAKLALGLACERGLMGCSGCTVIQIQIQLSPSEARD